MTHTSLIHLQEQYTLTFIGPTFFLRTNIKRTALPLRFLTCCLTLKKIVLNIQT